MNDFLSSLLMSLMKAGLIRARSEKNWSVVDKDSNVAEQTNIGAMFGQNESITAKPNTLISIATCMTDGQLGGFRVI